MNMLEMCQNNKVIMWGTGHMAENYAHVLRQCKIDLYACCDNNKEKWGKHVFGVLIMSPGELREVCIKESIVLLIATVYSNEIKEQVSNYNFVKVYGLKDLIKLRLCARVAEENSISTDLLLKVADASPKISGLFAEEEKREQLIKVYSKEGPREQFIEEYFEEEIPELRKKYKLSMCAIIKNEGEHLLEWIEYHRMIGVEHFYIYDNESTDGMYERIRGYIESGIITYTFWQGELQQLNAYNDALDKYKYESKYIAFFDGDEFLVPMNEKTVYEIINEIFLSHLNVGGIGINWRNYGSSFFEEEPEGLLFENYKYRAEDFEKSNAHIKTICNPRRVECYRHPHFPHYKGEYINVSENGSFIPDAFFYDVIGRKLRLHHYRKNMGEFRRRLLAGKPDIKREYSEEQIKMVEEEANRWNAVYDPIMDKYIIELQKRLIDYKNAVLDK